MFLGQERKNKRLVHNSDIFDLTLLRYLPTSCGTCVRLLKPPNAVPFHTLPVTNWKGRVEISWPAAATPTITEVPHPYPQFNKKGKTSKRYILTKSSHWKSNCTNKLSFYLKNICRHFKGDLWYDRTNYLIFTCEILYRF